MAKPRRRRMPAANPLKTAETLERILGDDVHARRVSIRPGPPTWSRPTDVLIDRLFLLNSTRADEERLAGTSAKGKPPKPARASEPKSGTGSQAIRASKRQLSLSDGEDPADA